MLEYSISSKFESYIKSMENVFTKVSIHYFINTDFIWFIYQSIIRKELILK